MYGEHVHIYSHTKTFLWVSSLPHMHIRVVSYFKTEHASRYVEMTSVTWGLGLWSS